jgi:hypothetical protein
LSIVAQSLAAVSLESNDALSTLYIGFSKKKKTGFEFNPDDRQHSPIKKGSRRPHLQHTVTKWSYFIQFTFHFEGKGATEMTLYSLNF